MNNHALAKAGALFLGSDGGPEGPPNGLQIALVRGFGLKIYKILAREGSERAPRPKKSSKRRS